MKQYDAIVIGAGMVGAAIAHGLVSRGLSVLALDGADGDFRASRANFGLVSLMAKGIGLPEYRALTRDGTNLWPDFAACLTGETGIDLQYERKGGLAICVGEAELEARRTQIRRLHNQSPEAPDDIALVDPDELRRLLPRARLGAGVSGALFGRLDGHVNPMFLLRALQESLRKRGGELRPGEPVQSIAPSASGGFVVRTQAGIYGGDRVIVAAGVATTALARQIGIEAPVRGQRGQVLVTERVAPFLDLPCSGVRQTGDGTVMIGLTQEEVGLNASVHAAAAARMSAAAVARFPDLAGAALVRQWAGLRVMTQDGFPIYARSRAYRGAYVAACHSGVSLAAIHAGPLAAAIAADDWPGTLAPFAPERFDVPQAA